MESSHGQLGTGLTDGLCSNNTYCLTNLNSLSCCHVGAVALCTDTHMGTAGQNGTNLHCLNGFALLVYAHTQNLCGTAGGNHVIVLHNHISVFIVNILAGISSCDSVLQALNGLLAIHECLNYHSGDFTLAFTTVCLADGKLLRYIYHSSGQITGVSGTKCGIG